MLKQDLIKWAKASAIRVIKTFAECMSSIILVGMAIKDVDWINALSVSCVAAFLCLLTCIKGLPECEEGEK